MEDRLLKIINEEIINLMSNPKIEEDFSTNLFIEGTITEKEYTSIMSEGIIGKAASTLVTKVLGMFKSAFANIGKLGKKALGIAKAIWGVVSKFCRTNGKFCKVTIVLIVILLVNSGTAYAAATGDSETPTILYNAAIGFLEQNSDMFQGDYGQMDFMQAKTILYGIRDGVGDITSMDDPDMANVSAQSKALAQHALKFMGSMADEAKEDPSKMETFYKYVTLGKQMILQSSKVME